MGIKLVSSAEIELTVSTSMGIVVIPTATLLDAHPRLAHELEITGPLRRVTPEDPEYGQVATRLEVTGV